MSTAKRYLRIRLDAFILIDRLLPHIAARIGDYPSHVESFLPAGRGVVLHAQSSDTDGCTWTALLQFAHLIRAPVH
jgi:hypothetical protein